MVIVYGVFNFNKGRRVKGLSDCLGIFVRLKDFGGFLGVLNYVVYRMRLCLVLNWYVSLFLFVVLVCCNDYMEG